MAKKLEELTEKESRDYLKDPRRVNWNPFRPRPDKGHQVERKKGLDELDHECQDDE